MSDPSVSSAPSAAATAAAPASAVQLPDVKESFKDSRVPIDTASESSTPSLIDPNMTAEKCGPATTKETEKAPNLTSCPDDSHTRNSEDSRELVGSLENLRLDGKDGGSNAGSSAQSETNDQDGSDGNVPTQDSATWQSVSSGAPSSSASPIRLLSREDEAGSVSVSPPTQQDSTSPASAIAPQEQQAFADQFEQVLGNPTDRPDPRLIDALENPRDRLFVIKLERDVISFVEEKTCEIFDLPQMNAFHRLLAHKTAEYYRLTHVADAQGSTLKMYRGQAARVPPTRLCDWPVSYPAKDPATNGTMPTVKIMRRTASEKSDRHSSKGSAAQSKDGSETSEAGSNKAATREEREALYQEARARIFKDFNSPPETPPPSKVQEKSKRRNDSDDFSGRSQFYPVVAHPTPYMPDYYSQYPNNTMQYSQMQQGYQGFGGPNSSAPRFNPASASFTPSAGYSPSAPHYATPQINRQQQFTPPMPPTDRPYSSFPNQQQMNGSLYPPRGAFSGSSSNQQAVPGYHGMASQQLSNNMMQPPYNQNGMAQQNAQGFPSQPHGFGLPNRMPSPRPAYPVPGSLGHSQTNPNQQHMPPGGYGWNGTAPGVGGVAMAPKSASAPGFDAQGGAGAPWQYPGPQKGAFMPPSQQWGGPGTAAGMGRGGMGGMGGMAGMNMNMRM